MSHLEGLHKAFNILWNLPTDRCCPLAGWLWWSCTATGTTTTRSSCENQQAPLAWETSRLAGGSADSQRQFSSWDLQNLLEDWLIHTLFFFLNHAEWYLSYCTWPKIHNFFKTLQSFVVFLRKTWRRGPLGLYCLNRTTEVERKRGFFLLKTTWHERNNFTFLICNAIGSRNKSLFPTRSCDFVPVFGVHASVAQPFVHTAWETWWLTVWIVSTPS